MALGTTVVAEELPSPRWGIMMRAMADKKRDRRALAK
jgi:hypothetical protein